MKIVAIIPARAGSKRLKKKNKLELNKKPLIEWTINFAKKLKELTCIIVSTDDKDIQKIALKNKVICSSLRPKYLSSDKAQTAEVCIYEINKLKKNLKFDAILLLQPTSPFRSLKNIKKAIKIFKQKKFNSLISVSKFSINKKTIIEKKGKIATYLLNAKKNLFKINGNFYLITNKELKERKKFFLKNTYLFETKTFRENIDIDDKNDFFLAQKIFRG